MRVRVIVRPRSKREGVKKVSGTHFVVAVNEPPIKGRANRAALEALADHLGVAPSLLRIVAGHTSREKIIEIL